MPDLRTRSYQAELMDDLEGGGDDMARTLDELEVINKLLGGYAVTLQALNKLTKGKSFTKENPLRIADLGCGGGDGLRIISQWAKKKGIPVLLEGIDANAFIVDYARQKSRDFPDISYRQLDIFSSDFTALSYDIISCALFCHHFPEESLVKLFMQSNAQARLGVIINDLHRHWFAYHSIRYLTKWLSRSPLIRNDAPLSVARGFKRKEINAIMDSAGVRSFVLQWKWAWRYQLVFGKCVV